MTTKATKVCVYGLWHLGAVHSACLAELGYAVVGVHESPTVVENLNLGRAPVFEPGLDELIGRNIRQHRLCYTTDLAEALKGATHALITFDTPVDDQDQVDLSGIYRAADAVGQSLEAGALVIISSQIPVGTGEELRSRIARGSPERPFGFAVVPENLRLGQAINNFMQPALIVVGAEDSVTQDRVEALYATLPGRRLRMDVRSAEMTKHALNAFLAASVSFINEIANLCDEVRADALRVSEALRADERIGPYARLEPGGLGFAGATLARDLKVLQALGQRFHYRTHLIDAILEVNRQQRQVVLRKLRQFYPSVANLIVGVLGLTYKPGTSTLRRSVALEIIGDLTREGASVKAYDPRASVEEVRQHRGFQFCSDPYEVSAGSHAIVIVTEWPEFKELDYRAIRSKMRRPVLIDTKNMLDPVQLRALGFLYSGVGRGAQLGLTP